MTKSHPPRINIIGAGRLGRSLAKLWCTNGVATIGSICNRSQESALEAVTFIGAGRAVSSIEEMGRAPLWLIATGDNEILTSAQTLSDHQSISPGDVVFHCSGSLSSECLEPVKKAGTLVASIHPIHSFANPRASQHTFSGSHCAAEGDDRALLQLTPLFEKIGGQIFQLSGAGQKSLYHCATVMACNYLVTLQNSALGLLQEAGMDRQQCLEILAPIVRQTTENIVRSDTVEALTGPVSRGDMETVARHLDALKNRAPDTLALYTRLAQHTLPLAAQQGFASQEQLDAIHKLLNTHE